MEKQKNNKPQQQRMPLLFRLTRRCVLFFLLLLVSNLLFYITGNYQLFLDSSQSLLLFLATGASLTLAFFAICAAAEAVFYIFKNDRKIALIIDAVLMLLIFTLSVIAALGTRSIIFISKSSWF